ncbi:MAG: UDP-N-acetylglucosamine--N-acetylmuramyl-(pentapeptide) pyrophosphoryl-undecaprenol N-acetylglucosamine transferase, partial [Caldilineales bacterium]|nr:UDP-N-acetylglucosamine--N-acetylmuramyl-(pentapeptide) pyrophosphoryl-undecaprenol N-acetylglucosamine transferase [Caldilineales bacterium]
MAAALPDVAARRQAAMPATATDWQRIDIRYAGTPDGVEAALAARAQIAFIPIRAGQMRIRNPLKLARNSLWLAQGLYQAWRLIRAWRPHVLFVTGGYACAPVVWAAHRHAIPILIYLPDLTPGLAVQRLARYAQRVAVSFPAVAAFFPGKAIVTGYPVRASLRGPRLNKAAARRHFDLAPDLPTLLVFGGSRGARSINIALAAILPQLLAAAQVIHITGAFDAPAAQERAVSQESR